MKKILLLLTILITCFTIFGVVAHAEAYDDVLEYEIVYEPLNNHAVITHCDTNAEGYITIPSYIDGWEVTEIGNNAFAGCTGITHIDMKYSNITKIGDAAFEGCTSLYGVYLSDDINYISVNAFLNCMSLSHIDISDLSVWCDIEFYDMYSNPLYYGGTLYINGTEIKDIVIPDGVAEIKNYAFYGMDIDSLTIPPSLKKVGASIISESCRIDLKVPSLEQICSIEYNNWNCLGRINDLYVDGIKTTDIIFPEAVTHIPERLFSEFSSLTSVTFPETVLSIGESAFYYCPNLQKVVIEGSETVVAANAFLSCTLLDTIIIPETAEFVGYNAFYNTMWYNSQPDGCIYIGNWLCGYKGNFTDVMALDIKDGTIGISPMFFSFGEGKDGETPTTLTTLYIPNSLEYIGNNVFEGCLDLKNIEFGNGIKYIGTHAFYNTAWYDSLSDGATYIGNILYKYKDDIINTQFDIRNGTTIIANGAFENCENLVTVTMTDSVTDIGDYAFAGCINLENIALSNNITRINESVFGSCTSLSSIKLPDSIESIGECAFYCSGLKSITLPDSIRVIENDAYASCDNLSGTIVIPDGVTYIGNGFRYSYYIDTIKIPDSVNHISSEAFLCCYDLKSVSISDEAYNRLAPTGCFETIPYAQFGRIITYMLDGEVYKTQVVPENTNVTLPEPENGYQYKFYVDGKEYNGEGVTEDTTVEIQRTAIVYVHFWGDFTESQAVPVGGNAVLPENPEDGYYTYTVSGSAWDGKNITSEVSVKVTKHLNQYTITYIFEDGTKQKETVTHGENALYPDFPEGCYYTYATESGSEWTGENITSDIEVYATEHPYVYTVTYIFRDRTEQTFLVNHGEDAPLLENPADGYYTYITYDGSDWTGKNITSNVKVLASKHLNVYTVTITFEDGSYQKINVTHGSSIQLPENPSYGYYTYSTSDGKAWDGTNITSDTKVYVTLHINVYRITYTFDDGTTETFYVNHGENAPFPQAIYDDQYTCIMSDGSIWTGKYVEADADILVTKQFNKYIVTYTGDYDESVQVTHGKNAVLPTNPADGYYTYATQDGAEWNGENITSDVTVIVTKHLNKYTVTFTGDYDESIQVTHGKNAVLPTNPADGYYTYATEDGTEWTGDNITSDVIVVVTKHLNKYTVTFTGDYDESVQVTHGENAILPENPYGYYYVYHTSDGAIWTGDNITSDVTVIVTKHLNKYTVTYTGDYDESVQVTHGDNAILPENPYGYHYIYHTSDGAIWTGEDITKDVVVTVTRQINIYTVTFAGDYTGTQEVEHGNDVVIPQSPDGYVYTYSANTSNVTSDRTVFLELLCDMAELTVSGLEYTFYDGNIIRGEYYDMWYDISNMSVSPGAVLKFIGYSDGGIVLKKGENIIAVTVVAESGKKQDYCLIINRNLPDSLGKLVFREAIGGTATLELPQGIKGNPEIKVSCTYTEIETGDDISGETIPVLVDKVALLNCVFNKDNNTIFVSSLLENTEYKFVVIASYEDVIIESQPVWATTGELKSTDCSITSVISPNGGTIDEGADGEMGSIFIRYYHDMGDNVKINVTVSEGATWDLYYGPTSSMTYTDKIITGIKPGMTKTAYIKVVSEAGEEHTKTYVVYVYRQTKSAKPEICVTNGMVSITTEVENVQIKYTIDGKSPGEQEGIVYTAPFEAPDGAVIRAVAKEAEKDETSDVAIYVVDKKPKAHITEISWYTQDKTHYEYEFYIDSMKSDTGIVIVAVYDEGHIMTGIDFSEFKCTNGEAIASGTVTTSSNGSWCKVFVINSLSDIKPLSDVLVRDTLS